MSRCPKTWIGLFGLGTQSGGAWRFIIAVIAFTVVGTWVATVLLVTG